MKIEIEVSDKDVENLLIGAFEGGSNYWIKRRIAGVYPLDPDFDGEITIETIDNEQFTLNQGAIVAGLRVFATDCGKHFGDWRSGRDDADTADVFLQCCLFGELVYG